MMSNNNNNKIRNLTKKTQNDIVPNEYVKKVDNHLDLIKQRIKNKLGDGAKKSEKDVFSSLNNFLGKIELPTKNIIPIVAPTGPVNKTNSKEQNSFDNESSSDGESRESTSDKLIQVKNDITLKKSSMEDENNEIILLEKRDAEIQTEENLVKKAKLDVNSFQKRNLIQQLIKLKKIVKEIKTVMSEDQLEELEVIKSRNKESVG